MKNTQLGRPPKLTKKHIEQILKLLDEGELYQHEIAELFDTTQPRISQIKKAHR